MVAAFDYCLHGKGGAAPSIDTAMHGLVGAPHVDHLHPDSGIALATAADGEKLTARVLRRPRAVGAVAAPRLPARPGHRQRSATRTRRPSACILGGHGITAWGETSEECEANSLEIIRTAQAYLDRARRSPSRSARSCPATSRCPRRERRAKAAAIFPTIRGLASTDQPQVGHYTDSDAVLEFLSRGEARRAGRAGHVLPRPLPAHQGQAAGRRPARHRDRRGDHRAADGAARGLPRRTTPPTTSGTPRRTAADARRRPGHRARARRRHVLLRQGQADRPGGRRVLRQRDQRDARRRGGVDLRADPRVGEVPHRVLVAGGGQAARMPKPKPLAARVALVTGAGIGHRQGDRRAGWPPRAPASSSPTSTPRRPRPRRPRSAAATWRSAVARRRDRRGRGRRPRSRRPSLAFGGVDLVVNNAGLSISKPLLETTVEDWDLQHDVMAKGSFLVAREAARVMIAQGLGGDIVYISSKNSRVRRPEQHRLRRRQGRPGPPGAAAGGRARPARHPGQRHQPRRRRARLRASSPAAGAPSAPRSTASRRRSWARTTPSARCSGARCCPSTSPPRSSR